MTRKASGASAQGPNHLLSRNASQVWTDYDCNLVLPSNVLKPEMLTPNTYHPPTVNWRTRQAVIDHRGLGSDEMLKIVS